MTHRCQPGLALTILLVVAASPCAHAQDPVPQQAPVPVPTLEVVRTLRQKLQTLPIGKTVAWGAWEAAETNARELVPDVVVAVRRTLAAPGDAARPFVLLALLDALIRLDAQLPAEDLAALARLGTMRPQTLVLASRDPKRHAAALEAIRAEENQFVDELERIATDNLLAVGAPARAVALLLPEVEIRIVVQVNDSEDISVSSNCSLSSACGRIDVPEGLPPTVLYELRRGAAKAPTLVADGAQPVTYLRTVRTERTFGSGVTRRPFDKADHALRLLRWIAKDVAEQSVLAASPKSWHRWQGPAPYLEEMATVLEPHRKAWRGLVDALVRGKWLTPEQVPASDPISVVVDDRRADKSIPLPTLDR